MGWISEQLRRVANFEKAEDFSPSSSAEESAASRSVWQQLLDGLRQDTEEFKWAGGECELEHSSDNQVRVVNPAAKIAAIVSADTDALIVDLRFNGEAQNVAVPEGGIFTVREHGGPQQLYSADQPLSLRQAREMVLQPVLFPGLPSDQVVA